MKTMLSPGSTSSPLLPRMVLQAAAALCMVGAFLALPSVVVAQEADASGHQHIHAQSARRKATGLSGKPLTQANLADAILGDVLSGLSEQTDVHFHQGEYNHIINLNRIIVQGDPKNLDAYSNSAWLLWSTDRSDDAVAFLKQGLQSNTDSYHIYDELGQHYLLHKKDAVTALPYYEKAVSFQCPYFTWNALARCYENTKQWDKAVNAWERASKYPEDKIALVHLERARTRLAQLQTK